MRTLEPVATSGRPATFLTEAGRSSVRAMPLVDVDGDLAAGMDATQLDALRRELHVNVLHLGRGPWSPPPGLERAVALLVTDGLLTCDERVAGECCAQLHGPGDILDARRLADGSSRWQARTPVDVAVVDGRMLLAIRRWPQLALGWTRRLLDAQHEEHVLATIRGLPRVEDRVTAFIGHSASRWGRVTSAGLTLELPVTHQVLGQLVAARRPTVSLALTKLQAEGRLRRLEDGRWLLPAPAVAIPASA
ncbi:MAG TPA: helix-turn-helix domain-containing protein [Solirubrobacteraceae bacterium]|nr:helix-turn-helix domain-containing protein [Solirubrobacteraceae bacterium]